MQTTNKRLIIVVLCALCALALALYMISASAMANNKKNSTAADGAGETVQMAAAETPESELSFTFTDTGVTASAEGEGYEIDGTALSISAAGAYRITGACGDGSITVKKGTTGVTLILDDLTLTSTDGSPLRCNKESEVTLFVTGTVTLTDAEDPADDDSADEAVADAFDGAAIKVKSGASLTVTGNGTLIADGSQCKNGIKGGAESTVTVEDGVTLRVTAANNGIASDNAVVIRGGDITVDADGDAIKAEPDEDDTTSAGTVTITGGTLTLTAGDDGIQSTGDLTVTGGTLTVASEDDALHSDANLTVTGGKLTIDAGDDALHAGYELTIGEKDASGGPEITVNTSEEGLEGAVINLCSGSGSIRSSDDGINAANKDLGNYDFAINVYGGEWTVNADGDGVDSNGSVSLYGGTLEVFGATNSGNAALDYDGQCTYEGGTLLTVDVSGMNQQPSTGVSVSFGSGGMGGPFGGFGQSQQSSGSFTISAGSEIVIKNAAGETIYTAAGVKNANCVMLASPDVTEGETYTLWIDGKQAATATAAAGNGQGGMMGGMGGFGQGQMPGGQTPSDGQMGQRPGQGGHMHGGFSGGQGGFPGQNGDGSMPQPPTEGGSSGDNAG